MATQQYWKQEYIRLFKELEVTKHKLEVVQENCQHPITNGDNYGVTCDVCGEVLEGYGCWGAEDTCIHGQTHFEDGGRTEVCDYCGRMV